MAGKTVGSNGKMMAGRMTGEPVTQVKGKQEVIVPLKKLNRGRITVRVTSLEGSPLVMHKFGHTPKKNIADKQGHVGKQPRGKRDPEAEYLEAIHIDEDGHVCMKSVAFKKGMVRACDSTEDMTMTRARGAFFVLGEFTKILYRGKPIKAPTKKGQIVPGISMATHEVRLNGKGADLRYRPLIAEWTAELKIVFNEAVCSAEQIVNLVNTAGFACGIGENRPEKSGDCWGMYCVAD